MLLRVRLRKVTRNRGQFPSEQAGLKVLYLAVRNLDDYRSPSVGTRSSGWKQARPALQLSASMRSFLTAGRGLVKVED